MIIWRVDRLKERIAQQPLSSRQLLPYAMASAIFAALAFVFADWMRPWDRDEFEAAVDSATTLLAGVISAFGVLACYRANSGESGSDFAGRMLAVGFVLFVRFIVCSAVVFIAWVYLSMFLKLEYLPAFEELDLLFVIVVAWFWFRLRQHIKSLA